MQRFDATRIVPPQPLGSLVVVGEASFEEANAILLRLYWLRIVGRVGRDQ